MTRSVAFVGGPTEERCVVDAVHRLDREFRGTVGRHVILGVVRRSRAELDGPPPGALPELVERLARQRLLQHVDHAGPVRP
jgi:hypothetical protein